MLSAPFRSRWLPEAVPGDDQRPASRTRRRLLGSIAGSAAFLPLGLPALAQDSQADGQPAPEAPQDGEQAAGQAFSFEALTEQMRQQASQDPHRVQPMGGFLSGLDYDDYHRIQFNPERGRWRDTGGRFQVNAFSPGWLFNEPVSVFEVVDGQATPMEFSADDFLFHGQLGERVPEDLSLPGVAGVRLNAPLNRADIFDEVVAFLGASYFRALGRGNRYGLSARGLAVNTALSGGEEFPRFSAFYLERPAPDAREVVLYAALESGSVTGAYRFVVRPGDETLVDVTARLFLRRDVEQLGLAPLTSMFLLGASDPGDFDDFRPAVHDSEALVVVTGQDTLYRPLQNPPRLSSSYLGAHAPQGFGLVQRNRSFEDFLDAQARYELRPSLMIEPMGDWGEGMVRLVEIPTKLEANDNIVAFWVPSGPFTAGSSYEFSYRMRWGMEPGFGTADLARVVRMRAGHGGVAGTEPAEDRRKFVIDFEGGLLGELPPEAEVTPSVELEAGELVETVLTRIDGTRTWRLVAEVAAPDDDLVEIKASLSGYGRKLTETWLFQWVK